MRQRVMVVVAFVAGVVILATPDCAISRCVYLPVVQYSPPPTPTPIPMTPVPAPISSLVIQPSDMSSAYNVDEFAEVTNAEAAKTYKDPKAALRAFQAQGRETSFYAGYSADFPFFGALGVSDQVYRYSSPAGAVAGQAYTIAEHRRDHPGYQPFTFGFPCCPTQAFYRTFVDGEDTYEQYLFSVQVGRYITDVQVVAFLGGITAEQAVKYAQIAVDRLSATPQMTMPVIVSKNTHVGKWNYDVLSVR